MMASGRPASVPAEARGEGHQGKGAGGPRRCGLGEWGVDARTLPALRHEFPNRLQHHGYLPGEPLPPAPGPRPHFSESPSCGSATRAGRCLAPSLAAWPSASVPRAREGPAPPPWWSGGGLRQPAPRPASIPPFPVPPLFCPLLEGVRGPQRPEPGPGEKGAVPKGPRNLRTASLTHGLEKCGSRRRVRGEPAGQWERAAGDTWVPAGQTRDPGAREAAPVAGGLQSGRLPWYSNTSFLMLSAARAPRVFF